MRRFCVYIVVVLIIPVLLVSCAQVQTPTGGAKDTESPVVSSSYPISGSTNFEGNALRMDFDEYVVLNNLQSEITISPPLTYPIDYKIKGKSLFIKFSDTLEENTTYTFNLGNGIKDYHEGNILDSNVIVFSTGPAIDSGFVMGRVSDAISLKEIKKVLVMLYEETDDSIPAKKRPLYYSKSRADGSFAINYLKTGKYQMFVLEDLNNNYLYDSDEERIGFADNLIDVEGSQGIAEANVSMFKEFYPNQYFVGATADRYGKITLGFNQPFDSLEIRALNTETEDEWYYLTYDDNKDTARMWTSLETKKNEEVELELIVNGEVLDTTSLIFEQPPTKEDQIKGLKPDIRLNLDKGVAKYFEPLVVTSSSPILWIAKKALFISESDSQLVDLEPTGPFELQVKNIELEEESKYQLIIFDSTLYDAVGFSHDTLNYKFKTLSEVEYANLDIKLSYPQNTPVVIYLLSADEKTLFETVYLSSSGDFRFENLSPGKYRMKLLYDDNNNGEWDPGTFIPRKQAEKMIYFSGELDMKEGWDNKIEWIIPE